MIKTFLENIPLGKRNLYERSFFLKDYLYVNEENFISKQRATSLKDYREKRNR